MVLVSGVQSDSVIHTHASIPLQILFPSRSSHNTKQSSLCYTVGPPLAIHFKHSSVYMPIANSLTVPAPHPSLYINFKLIPFCALLELWLY